jgi:hypothetical protein
MKWRALEAALVRLFASHGAEISDWGGDITITCAGDRSGRQKSIEISLTDLAHDLELWSTGNE